MTVDRDEASHAGAATDVGRRDDLDGPGADEDWKALPHWDLEQLADGLWSVCGELSHVPLGRRMTIARFADGRLFVHGPMALTPPAMAELDRLGEVAVIYVPSGMHRMDCARYRQRYPDAQLVCPSGASPAVRRKVSVDATIAGALRDDGVWVEELEGTGGREGVLHVLCGGELTLVFNDLLFNLPHQPGLAGLFLRLMGSSGGPRVTRTARFLVVEKRALVAVHLNRLSREPGLIRLIPGHGELIEGGASAVLRGIAETL